MRKGFTLVELSIALVIIGLLIGGILVAQSMIHSAKINRFVKEVSQYEISIQNFKLNYRSYPGDAPSFTPPGNGNGAIGLGGGCAASPNDALSAGESTQVWAHLAQANMSSTRFEAYSPSTCPAGTHAAGYGNEVYAGVLWPYTEVDAKASAGLNVKKSLISVSHPLGSNLYMEFYTSTAHALGIENKIGVSVNNSPALQVGLVNAICQVGMCENSSFDCNPCDHPEAQYGHYFYYIQPL